MVIMKLVFSGKRTPMSQITDDLRRNNFISSTTHHALPHMLCYALRKTARDNEEQFPDALKYVERNIYMDYLYVSTNSLEAAQKIRQGKRNTLSKGGFSQMEFKQSRIPKFIRN